MQLSQMDPIAMRKARETCNRPAYGTAADVRASKHIESPFWHIPAFLVRRLQLICTAIVAEAVEAENLSMPQWAVLVHIAEMPDIDQSRLAEMASIDKTNTGRLVDQLESMALVERRPNGADRRAWMLRLTPRGQELRRRLQPRALASQKSLLSCLTAKERETFVGLLCRVVAANDTYIRPGAGRRKPGGHASISSHA